MKKTFLTLVIIAMIAVSAFALVSCNEDEEVFDGKDEYGRSFGEIYDIDSESTAVSDRRYVDYGANDDRAVLCRLCGDREDAERIQTDVLL